MPKFVQAILVFLLSPIWGDSEKMQKGRAAADNICRAPGNGEKR